MPYPKPKWCTARNGDVVCQRRYGHDGPHRCETGEPTYDENHKLIGQVISWN